MDPKKIEKSIAKDEKHDAKDLKAAEKALDKAKSTEHKAGKVSGECLFWMGQYDTRRGGCARDGCHMSSPNALPGCR